jgi:hypothetical protein
MALWKAIPSSNPKPSSGRESEVTFVRFTDGATVGTVGVVESPLCRSLAIPFACSKFTFAGLATIA